MKKVEYRPLIFKSIISWESLKKTQQVDMKEFWLLMTAKLYGFINKDNKPYRGKTRTGLKGYVSLNVMINAGLIKRVTSKSFNFALTAAGEERLNDILDYIYESTKTYRKLPKGAIKDAKIAIAKLVPLQERNIEHYKREYILKKLNENNWNIIGTARSLGWVEGTIRYHIKKHGLKKGDTV